VKCESLQLLLKMEPTQCSETSAFNTETPGKYPEDNLSSNIKMDLQEVGCRGMDWIAVAQDRGRWRALVTALMNLRVS
jgi:hypothetical protein